MSQPSDTTRQVFAIGRRTKDETRAVELRTHCPWHEPLTDEQRRMQGVRWTSVMCAGCREDIEAGTWTPDGPEAA